MAIKRALVLSGGSAKGAFQAGAIKAFLDHGYKFDSVYGISVGSLNGVFIANEAGKQNQNNDLTVDSLDWKLIGNGLVEFWTKHITSEDRIIENRTAFSILLSIIRKRFNGLVDPQPIMDQFEKFITLENLKKSPVQLTVGAVNIFDGEMKYADNLDSDIKKYVFASTAIPILLPLVEIGKGKKALFLDGGIRDVAPLKKAIDAGAEEIVCISCQSKMSSDEKFEPGNLKFLANRIMDIVSNEILNNDLKLAEFINSSLSHYSGKTADGPLKGRREIIIKVVRPHEPLAIDLEKFDAGDIKKTIELGVQAAEKEL
jgi:NTE family protein